MTDPDFLIVVKCQRKQRFTFCSPVTSNLLNMHETIALETIVVMSGEADLIRDAVAGDHLAFERLMDRCSQRTFRLALRMLGSREDAEDVQQETFVLAYRRLRSFRSESSFITWVYSIAAHLCLSRKRSASRRPVQELDDAELLDADVQDNPEQQLMALEFAAKVQKVLHELAPTDRLIIILKFVEQLSHEEIAQVLGCSAQSSRSRLLRAKKLFRERYENME